MDRTATTTAQWPLAVAALADRQVLSAENSIARGKNDGDSVFSSKSNKNKFIVRFMTLMDNVGLSRLQKNTLKNQLNSFCRDDSRGVTGHMCRFCQIRESLPETALLTMELRSPESSDGQYQLLYKSGEEVLIREHITENVCDTVKGIVQFLAIQAAKHPGVYHDICPLPDYVEGGAENVLTPVDTLNVPENAVTPVVVRPTQEWSDSFINTVSPEPPKNSEFSERIVTPVIMWSSTSPSESIVQPELSEGVQDYSDTFDQLIAKYVSHEKKDDVRDLKEQFFGMLSTEHSDTITRLSIFRQIVDKTGVPEGRYSLNVIPDTLNTSNFDILQYTLYGNIVYEERMPVHDSKLYTEIDKLILSYTEPDLVMSPDRVKSAKELNKHLITEPQKDDVESDRDIYSDVKGANKVYLPQTGEIFVVKKEAVTDLDKEASIQTYINTLKNDDPGSYEKLSSCISTQRRKGKDKNITVNGNKVYAVAEVDTYSNEVKTVALDKKYRQFSPQEAKDAIKQLNDNLAQLLIHRIRHNDLHMQNILCRDVKGKNLIQFIDFGRSAIDGEINDDDPLVVDYDLLEEDGDPLEEEVSHGEYVMTRDINQNVTFHNLPASAKPDKMADINYLYFQVGQNKLETIARAIFNMEKHDPLIKIISHYRKDNINVKKEVQKIGTEVREQIKEIEVSVGKQLATVKKKEELQKNSKEKKEIELQSIRNIRRKQIQGVLNNATRRLCALMGDIRRDGLYVPRAEFPQDILATQSISGGELKKKKPLIYIE